MPRLFTTDLSGTTEEKQRQVQDFLRGRIVYGRGKIAEVGLPIDSGMGGTYGCAVPVQFSDGTFAVLQRVATGKNVPTYRWIEQSMTDSLDSLISELNDAIMNSERMPEVFDTGSGWRYIKVWKGGQYGEIRIGECFGKEENPDSLTWRESKRAA